MNGTAVLFSGGVDSTTALHWALSRSKDVRALTFDYGQRHGVEIRMARRACRRLGVPQHILKIDLRQIGGSSLTDASIPVPKHASIDELGGGPPATYVPFRNGVFLALAAAWAEARGIGEIVVGFNVVDSPNYPDTREAFVKAMEKAVNLGTKAVFTGKKIRISAPFVDQKKSAIIKSGLALGADYSWSVSCYRGGEVPCGTCSSCLLRRRAWEEAGAEDHLVRRLRKEGKL